MLVPPKLVYRQTGLPHFVVAAVVLIVLLCDDTLFVEMNVMVKQLTIFNNMCQYIMYIRK